MSSLAGRHHGQDRQPSVVAARTTAVHVKAGFDVYIGRAMPSHAPSEFANPFRIGPDGSRNEVLEKYAALVRKRLSEEPSFAQALRRLKGKRLGCWCKPQACHGDILVGLLEGDEEPANAEQMPLF